MPRVKSNLSAQIPSMQNWGGIRSIQKRLERSATIMENKEAVAYSLLCMANTKITDIMEWDEAGQIKVKASKDIPEHALQAIRSIKVNKDGNLELELYDKVGVLRLLAKASGLLDSPDDSDKPSVIGINIKPPDIEDVEIK
jgi:formylmethanofuran:tetrahydromethanopterin formyltransferase